MGFGWLGFHRRVYCGAIGTISRNWPTLSDSKAPNINGSEHRKYKTWLARRVCLWQVGLILEVPLIEVWAVEL